MAPGLLRELRWRPGDVSPALLGIWRIDAAGDPEQPLRDDEVVEDVESLVRGVIGGLRTTSPLSPADHDELMGALFEQVVVLTRSYDGGRVGGRVVFRAWLFRELRFDAIDFLRSWLGRQGQKRVFDERVLDAGRRDTGLDDDGDPAADRLRGSAGERADGDERDRTVPVAWLHFGGDREAA